jgi:signal transduction histidine kinase
MLTLGVVIYQGIKDLTRDYVISRLQHDADSVIAALMLDQDGLWHLPSDRLSTVYTRVRSGHYYLVSIAEQTIVSRSLFDIDIEVPQIAQGDRHCFAMSAPKQEQWMVCLQKIMKSDNAITIWVAEDISPLEKAQVQFLLFALGALALTIIALLFFQYRILQRGFSQLERVRESIGQMHLDGTGLSNNELPIEILPLVTEIERLLSQLSTRVQRSRNALGNLAHELKRPLQRYKSQLETLNPEQRNEGDSILQDIQSVVDRELKRARIVGVSTPGRHTVIDDDLPHLVQVIEAVYPGKSIEMKYSKNLIIPHDRDDILELLGNLLDNACKFARQRISISIESCDQGWRVCIEDDGEGVTERDLNIITDRGVRLDESTQGHGLGLSICRDIVESYSGHMQFTVAELGGLSVTVFLPARPGSLH